MTVDQGIEVLAMLGTGFIGICLGALVLYVKWAIYDRWTK